MRCRPPPTSRPSRTSRDSEVYQEARAEIRHELDEGELHVKGERDDFPPTHYDRT